MADIKLNFINQSNDRNNSEVILFQKNQATNYEELAVAWMVIQNCGQGWSHPFTYPMDMYVSAKDSYNNCSQQLLAANGQQFKVVTDQSGDVIKFSGQASSQTEVEVLNANEKGAIDANIFKNGKLLATKTGIAPGQKAAFEFKPTLWIGVASQVEEGAVINTAILSQFNTELSLFGIKSADIIMTGGGPGTGSTSFEFTLANVVYGG